MKKIFLITILFTMFFSQKKYTDVIDELLDTLSYEGSRFETFEFPGFISDTTLNLFYKRYKSEGIPLNTKEAFNKGVKDALDSLKNGVYPYAIIGKENLQIKTRNNRSINIDSLYDIILKRDYGVVHKFNEARVFKSDPADAYFYAFKSISNNVVYYMFGIDFKEKAWIKANQEAQIYLEVNN